MAKRDRDSHTRDASKGKRPLDYERCERVTAIARLRRAGLSVPDIAKRLGVSDRTVRRAIAVRNKLARKTLAFDAAADLQQDVERLTDLQRQAELALVSCLEPRDLAQLLRAAADVARVKHAVLTATGLRRLEVQPVVDQATLDRANGMTTGAVLAELQSRARMVLERVEALPVRPTD